MRIPREIQVWLIFMAVISLVALACELPDIIDWFDQRSCRISGGTVQHFDLRHEDAWRCVPGQVER